MRQIILDTETTGLSPIDGHRIIEIAGVELENRRLTGRQFHKYINPERAIDIEAQKVHGLSAEFLKDKPLFSDIVYELIEFIKGAELVIHNAPFDVGFLNHEFKLLVHDLGEVQHYCQVLDTLELARQLHPGQRNSLDALCKRYNVDNSGRELHGALIDADLLAMIYLAMTSGQEALFGEAENIVEKTQTVQVVQSFDIKHAYDNLKIFLANEFEIKQHQSILNAIEKKAQRCIWLE